MANHLITYLDGDTETITASRIEPFGDQYVAYADDGSATAYIPICSVRSVVRQNHDEANR
ncbi:hypothetical protein [Streptomyces sp. NPDC047315]|uniref:hypothetical protein n=1 Tax=Streptomyces sp. NPDC047315 TaxID=3155142 RepID=UPI0033E5CA78